ncbi:GNAT family N-acetyltransferase [Streptomyces sp. NPDC050560]|uniref:GNAT family N-acetyltransferase n=1 Tax=Streptomyces sp. NPDC050560 TaxID=3365630 RepID=UPI0037A469BA
MDEVAGVRGYRGGDLRALYEICVRTGHRGGDARGVFGDPDVLPVTFAEPYVALAPELAFVLDDGTGRAVGYVLGTADTARFVKEFREVWLPRVAGRYPRPAGAPGTPDEFVAELLHTPERMLLPALAGHPAHLHIDLLPDWQHRGFGRRLMRAFLDALHARGVARVHLTMANANTGARAFYDRMGFYEIEPPGPDVTHLGRTTAPDPGPR